MNIPEKCPNAPGCQVLIKEDFLKEHTKKQFYRLTYCCVDTAEGYFQCKRFQTKKALGFCPDFILPDSEMTIEEIMDKCEEE